MNFDFPLWKPSRPYTCPADAGPAWRAAFAAGYDMAAVEDNLKLKPGERLEKNDREREDFLKREEFFDLLRRGRDFVRKLEHRSVNRKS